MTYAVDIAPWTLHWCCIVDIVRTLPSYNIDTVNVSWTL